jgi:hypothetical protein
MNGDRPLISLNPSADGVSYPPVLHALKITTIASAGATSINVLEKHARFVGLGAHDQVGGAWRAKRNGNLIIALRPRLLSRLPLQFA